MSESQQTGSYHVNRRARVTIINFHRVGVVGFADGEHELNTFLTELTDPGWQFQFHWHEMILSVVAVLDDLEQDAPTHDTDTHTI